MAEAITDPQFNHAEMSAVDIIYCIEHAQTSIAKCLTCSMFMCLDCLLDHQSYNHPSKKLIVITEEYIDRLQGNIESLLERLSELRKNQEASPYRQRLTQGFEMLEMCKFEILQLVEKHFEQLKDQFVKVMQAAGSHAPDRQAQDFLNNKIEEYRQLISELQRSPYRFNEVSEHYIQDDLNSVLQVVERKEQQAHRMGPKESEYPRLQLNELALNQLGDSLSQLIGFEPPKELTKKMLRIDLKWHARENYNQALSALVESSALMLMYEVRDKKAVKVSFRDFICPMKAKTAISPMGKLAVIGGEKLLSDGSLRYNRQINVLDTKFCMMKVAALMKEGRIHHSLVAVQEGGINHESVFILGGKNTSRLSSFEKFEFGSNTISQLKSYRSPLGGQTGIHISGKLYYFGGIVEEELSKQVLIYEIASDAWSSITPFNSLNYLPTIDPIVLPINKENIVVLGGFRKESNSLPYTSQYVQHYNIPNNYFPYTFNQRIPCGLYSITSNFQLLDGVFYMIASRKADNLSYGPNIPELLKVDINRQRISIDSFMQI